MNRFFVTGTDTGIGKTVLSTLLVAALDAYYWKPIQTGAIEGTDSETVARIAQIPSERLLPEKYLFDPPVSPHLAAREAGIAISLDAIILPAIIEGRACIVEGAGGVMVPINGRLLMRDLMQRLSLPAIVATRTTLGTINHTLLTLAALRDAQIQTAGVVMIGDENIENRRAIEHYGSTKVIGHIPMLRRIDRATLLEVFAQTFDPAPFGKAPDPHPNSISGSR